MMRNNFAKAAGLLACLAFILFSALYILNGKSASQEIIKSEENDEFEEEEFESRNKQDFIDKALKQEFERTKDPATNTVPRERLLKASETVNRYFARQAAQRAIPGIKWVERGPSGVGGRTRALIFDKRDPTGNTVFAGSVSGGLWKTTNLTQTQATWTKIGDTFENVAINSIVQDPSNYSFLYFGTGETHVNADRMRGLGIWKSTDGGSTWKQLISTNNSDFYFVPKIVVNNRGIVFAATLTGVKKSVDGGSTWTTVLTGDMADLEIASNQDVYASNFNGGLFKSTASNQGAPGSWLNITPEGNFQRIEIATAPSDANKAYILCQGAFSNDCDSIFRTDDAGDSWKSCPVPTIIDQGNNSNFTRGQAWYDLIATVDPNAPETVIIGGVDALKSVDGGNTWNQITTWALPLAEEFRAVVHADHHAIEFVPGSSSRAIWGTDGGVYYTDNVDVVVTDSVKPFFLAKNDGYNVTQFYSCAIHPEAGSNYFLAGSQDNGTQKFNEPSPGVQRTVEATGGDGGFCFIDQLDPSLQITSYVLNSYRISRDGGATFEGFNNFTRGSFINPTDFDNKTKFIYGDATVVSTGIGGAYSKWNTDSARPAFVTVPNFDNASVTHVSVSPVTDDRVYFGLSNGSVVYVNNASGESDTKVGVLIKTGIGSVSGIAIDPADENHILVTYSNYGVVSVFESLNAMSVSPSWSDIENNLPDMPVRWVVFNPINSDQAMIATELGVWTTDDLDGVMTEWNPTNHDLANTRVDMLKVRSSDNTVAAATHGRGLFTTTFNNVVLPDLNFKEGRMISVETGNVPTTCGLSYKDIPVTLMLSNPAAGDVSISITVDPASTAWKGVDFDLSTTTLTFPAGSTSQSFDLRLYDDFSKEERESVLLHYAITSGDSVATKGTTFQTYQLEILDNEAFPFAPFISEVLSGQYTTNLGPSSPLQATQSDKKSQYLYRGTELLANGLRPGPLRSLSFIVATQASLFPYQGFTIKVGQVPAARSDVSNGFVSSANFTTIYTAPEGGFTPSVGNNEFALDSFVWDGKSNIVIEYCYNNPNVGEQGTDDILAGETTTYASQARRTSILPSDDGCAFPAAVTTGVSRPLIIFSQLIKTTIGTALNTSKQAALGPFETIHFFDDVTGSIIASIQNLDGWNYGCTDVTIDRAGNGAEPFLNNEPVDFLASKTVYINAVNNNPQGHLLVTLYYTAEETEGWESATKGSWSSIGMIKVKNAHIKDITPGNPNIVEISSGTIVERNTLGADHYITGEFYSGLSGFGVGYLSSASARLGVTMLGFSGKIQNRHSFLEWQTAPESNNKGFEIERSSNGSNFKRIGFVATKGANKVQKYSFSDPQVSGPIQYYRLQQTDLNNKRTYSAIVLLRDRAADIYLSPNPFSDYVDIKFSEPLAGKTEATITDLSGKLVMRSVTIAENSISWRLNPGKNLAPGIYVLKMRNSGAIYSYKILKK